MRRKKEVIDQSIEILRRRVDETGTIEPTIVRQGDDRILLQVPGIKDTTDLKRKINQTAKLTFHLVNEDVAQTGQNIPANVPPTTMLIPTREGMQALRAANPKADVWLDATWSRADQTYPGNGHWHGKPIQQMGKDIHAGYLKAAAAAHATGVIPLGLAWNRAFDTGVADANPYDGTDAGKLDLWAWDHYHASIYGYYLEALMVFGKITGKDPLSLGENESVAQDMGFSKPQTRALQQVAHDQLAVD